MVLSLIVLAPSGIKGVPCLQGSQCNEGGSDENSTLLQGLVDGLCFLFDRSHSPPESWGLAPISCP